MQDKTLYLHEQLMLLALGDEKGTIVSGSMYAQGVGGAILAELVLRNRVTTVTSGRKTFATVSNPSPVGEPVLDECLGRIAGAKRRATLQTWVTRFAGLRGLKHRVAGGLARRGILRADESTVLLLFRRQVYPERDHEPERRIIERLDRVIRSESQDVEPATAILLALAHHSRLLRRVFDKDLLKRRKTRIESVIKGEAIGKATREAIQAIEAAVMVAAIMPAVVASTTH